jgi:RimJ/RimL family protein N-acetyltransferase
MRPSQFLREKLALRDGRTAVLRPIDPSDAPLLIDLHNHLSFESQYYRFFGPKPNLTQKEAEYLANVDFHKRFAIVAEIDNDGSKEIVGVGRFDINQPGVGEAAIVIRDDYQHVGLGTAILNRMREVGRGAGLREFSAEVLAENSRMLELLQANGLEVARAESGVVRVSAPLDLPILLRGLSVGAQFASAVIGRLPGRDTAPTKDSG